MSEAAKSVLATDTAQGTLSERVGRFAAGLTWDDIPTQVRERSKYLILDAVGIALAAGRFPFANTFMDGLSDIGEAGSSSVIGFANKLPLRDAAIMNGALAHGLDFDDTHMKAVVHATAASWPTTLVMGEKVGASGQDMLVAYTIGMEVAIRIGMASNFGFHHNGLHATGIAAHFGSALIAGRMLGLDAEALAMAQGLVGSTCQASQQFVDDGAWNKRFHPGWGGAAGITAAYLARRGFVAPREPYEGRFGLFQTLTKDPSHCEPQAVAADLGTRWEGIQSAIKPFPTCHFTHAVADAALELRRRHGIRHEDIARIRALVPAETIPIIVEPVANKRRPVSDYDAKFSAQFITATCFVRGRFGLAELESDVLLDPVILALADKVDCEPDPEADFPRVFPGTVIVSMKDGTQFVHSERVNRGAEERALSEEEIEQKYDGNAIGAVGAAKANDVKAAVLGLDRTDARTLASVLSA
jgi:2-methylcitrate dehydratase PrpD